MIMSSSWLNQAVKHLDGRIGVVVDAVQLPAATDLTIAVAGGGHSNVRLHHVSADSGEPGWYWQLQDSDGGFIWLPLGHQNSHQTTDFGQT